MEYLRMPGDPDVLDRISEAVYSLDRQWRIVYMNKAAVEFLVTTKTSEELLGKNLWNTFPQLKRIPKFEEIMEIFNTKRIIEYEFIGPISHRWRQAVFYPSDTGVSIVLRDITKEKEIENKLREEKQWSSNILDSIQDGFVVVDKHMTYLYANQQVADMIGVQKESLLGKKFTEIFPDHSIDIGTMIQVVKNAWIEKKSAHLEIFFRPYSAWYSIFVYPFEDKFSVLFRDITKRKMIEEELQNSKAQLDVIFKHVSDGIFIQDKTGKLIYANDAAANLCGYKNSKLLLTDVPFDFTKSFDLFDMSGNPLSSEDLPVRDVFSKERQAGEITVKAVHKKTPKTIWAIVKTAALKHTDGDIKFVISIIHDITKLKELEIQKDNLISMASHELKTPLTSAKVYMQILYRKCTGENDKEIRKILDKVNNDIDKLSALIQDILYVSRTQQGKLKLDKHTFSLSSLVRKVAGDIQPITSHPITVISPSNYSITGDKDRIKQVVINLLMNAIKYSEKTKQIIVKVRQQNGETIVSVQDFGLGIPRQDAEKIFNKFYQSTKHKTFPGLGLGLYISAEIIKKHGGNIWVESEEGEGSTFYFSLPKKPETGKDTVTY